MALKKKGKYWYGDTSDDIREEVVRYSASNAYCATKFAQPVCVCGSTTFKLESDEDEGVGRRTCTSCHQVHLIGTALSTRPVLSSKATCACATASSLS